jgi:hypothetical protein
MPRRLGPLGRRVWKALKRRLGEQPSFVGFEGYDTMVALAAALSRTTSKAFWSDLEVPGTRGRISFWRAPEQGLWQWTGSPVAVVDWNPDRPASHRVLKQK